MTSIYFLQFWRLGSRKIKCRQRQCLARACFLVYTWLSSSVSCHGGKGVRELFGVSFMKARFLFMRALPSKGSHPSTITLGFSIYFNMKFEGTEIFNPEQCPRPQLPSVCCECSSPIDITVWTSQSNVQNQTQDRLYRNLVFLHCPLSFKWHLLPLHRPEIEEVSLAPSFSSSL